MSEDKSTIKVTVLDEPFRLRSAADSEYTRDVAAHVDRTLRQLRSSAPTLEPFQTAVLGAMEITDSLLEARRTGAESLAEAVARVRGLEADLDGALAETAGLAGKSTTDKKKSRRK
ncbi:MAG: cell division protein ZapA [Gemmatimonadota bacterium]